MRWPRFESSPAPDACPETDPDRAHSLALDRGDEVVQQLAIAKYALTVGDTARAMAAIDTALAASRQTLTDLLRTARRPGLLGYAGAMVRTIAAAPNRAAPAPPQRASSDAL